MGRRASGLGAAAVAAMGLVAALAWSTRTGGSLDVPVLAAVEPSRLAPSAPPTPASPQPSVSPDRGTRGEGTDEVARTVVS